MTSFLRRRRLGAAGLAAFAAVAAPRVASATNCADLPAPVYMVGGNSPKPLVAKVATALTSAQSPRTIVFQSPGACLGIDAILSVINSGPSASTSKMSGTASYWDATGHENTCNLSITGDLVQVGIGNNFPLLCPEVTTVPASFGDFTGPVMSFDLVVPKASSQTNISAAALYFVYGFGPSSMDAAPWTIDGDLFKRGSTSAAGLLIAQAINVPIAKMKGTDAGSNSNMVADLAASANPEATLGMVSDDFAVANPNSLTVLAYQHYGQTCGYWPSKTANSLDKENVRDGHYWIWGYTHFYAPVDNTGAVVDPDAKSLINLFTRETIPQNGIDVLSMEVTTGNVPQCAMEVSRTTDLGSLASYAPDTPCGCYFEATATGQTSCSTCQTDNDCSLSATHCRFGYCEVN